MICYRHGATAGSTLPRIESWCSTRKGFPLDYFPPQRRRRSSKYRSSLSMMNMSYSSIRSTTWISYATSVPPAFSIRMQLSTCLLGHTSKRLCSRWSLWCLSLEIMAAASIYLYVGLALTFGYRDVAHLMMNGFYFCVLILVSLDL